ncbi:uncharacterized protein LOC126374606 [Pectinophora gossypiella]|uniref:uncharacterized protein LOC126374606 n=1 Tax=Pectinophora gossypiella TaxID=13191 RepID=UPI00214E0E77|nr:uncharacterized protein LOC126374606 [Pectinophora gossypiella]
MYGIAHPWNFLCQRKYWFVVKKKIRKKQVKGVNFHIFRNFNEPDCHAVENVDLEIHKGEITVLLGVNGAGKSTLLSIVTGELKGDTIASGNKDHLMRALDLIVCALIGDADVLVLDEPTAGMDSKMRHRVWDLLLALRKYKTLLVATTVMREADAIGDRIAIINKGSLKCHGSPAFLKSAIDQMEDLIKGFRLHMYQLTVLMKRVFTFVWFHKYQFILLQVLVPFIAFILVTLSSNTYGVRAKTTMLTSNDIPNATVLYHPVGYRRLDVFNPLITHYPHVKFASSNNLHEDFQKIKQKTKFGYKMAGNRTDIYYTSDPLYKKNTASTAVNIFSNMFMSLHMPYASKDHHITTSIEPLQFKSSQGFKNLYLCFGWAMWVVFRFVLPLLLTTLHELSNANVITIAIYAVQFLGYLNPIFGFANGMYYAAYVARNNAFCRANFHLCPNFPDDFILTKTKCCDNSNVITTTNYTECMVSYSQLHVQSSSEEMH